MAPSQPSQGWVTVCFIVFLLRHPCQALCGRIWGQRPPRCLRGQLCLPSQAHVLFQVTGEVSQPSWALVTGAVAKEQTKVSECLLWQPWCEHVCSESSPEPYSSEYLA